MTALGASAAFEADNNSRRKKTKKQTTARNVSVVPEPPGSGTIRAARFALLFTGVAWLAYVVEQVMRLSRADFSLQVVIETGLYVTLVTFLTLSAVAYLLTRIGYFERIRTHRRVARSTIDDYFEDVQPSLTVLVPSYREDERIIRQTLLSAALQEYPNLRVVLLLDDPPSPSDDEQRRSLERARAIPNFITDALKRPHAHFMAARRAFERETTAEMMASEATLEQLARYYTEAASWLMAEGRGLPRVDHTDDFLVSEVFERTVHDLETTATALRAAAAEGTATISRRRVHQLYTRLERIFCADVVSFERKQFASLSHEANKAMNLNSYLGLMGGRYSVVPSPGGSVLLPTSSTVPDLIIPDSDYVLTLDADSMLLPEYCLRLVYFMEQEENAKVAVAQTPYSAFRGATSLIERIGGATTDVQHIIHQGLTHHNATFWVGANAVIRKRALEDIEELDEENGFVIKRYIKDRTVIEDTESSIDLRAKGWSLYNYPERLSYSATPPDFGSMVIQRQRWANGGLVILPKLFRLFFRRSSGAPRMSILEFFLRMNYLASISWASLGLLLLLFYPFDDQLLSRFAVVTALPYFWAMSNDLHRSGYRRLEIFAVYGFNLLLLPVNFAGTVQSIAQGIGGHKIAFARTPKVQDHTVAPLAFVLLPLLLIAWSARTLIIDINSGYYVHGAFATANLVTTAFACIVLIGLRGIILDILVNIREFIYRPARVEAKKPGVPYWASVLYVGSSVPEEVNRSAPIAVALAAQDRFGVEGEVGKEPQPALKI